MGRLQKVQVCQNEHLVLSEQCSRQGLSCAFFHSFIHLEHFTFGASDPVSGESVAVTSTLSHDSGPHSYICTTLYRYKHTIPIHTFLLM